MAFLTGLKHFQIKKKIVIYLFYFCLDALILSFGSRIAFLNLISSGVTSTYSSSLINSNASSKENTLGGTS